MNARQAKGQRYRQQRHFVRLSQLERMLARVGYPRFKLISEEQAWSSVRPVGRKFGVVDDFVEPVQGELLHSWRSR